MMNYNVYVLPILLFHHLVEGHISSFIPTTRSFTTSTSSTRVSSTKQRVIQKVSTQSSRSRNIDKPKWNVNTNHHINSSLKAGFFDDLMNGKLFNDDNDKENENDGKKNSNNKNKTQSTDTNKRSNMNSNGDDGNEENDELVWNEADFQQEVFKRRETETSNQSSTTTATTASVKRTSESGNNDNEEEAEFDGYALRDAIYNKYEKCFDVDFQPVQTFGFRELYLNILPFHLNGRRFRHATELDYLCHLQAIVEILVKYDQLEYVLSQLEETNKKPRAGTSPLVAVPLRLDLTEDELNSILA